MLISIILIVYCQAEEEDGGEDRPTSTARNCTCGISDIREDLGQHHNQPDIKKEPGGQYPDNEDNSRGSEEPSCTNNKRLFSGSGIWRERGGGGGDSQ